MRGNCRGHSQWLGCGRRNRSCQEQEQKRLTCTDDLLALVVRPETTQAVAHLAEPRARNAVEETADACRVVRLLYRLDHALVAGGLQAHFRQVERAV